MKGSKKGENRERQVGRREGEALLEEELLEERGKEKNSRFKCKQISKVSFF